MQLSYDVQSRYKVGIQCGNFSSKEALHTAHSYLHVFQLYFLQVNTHMQSVQYVDGVASVYVPVLQLFVSLKLQTLAEVLSAHHQKTSSEQRRA